MPTTSQLENGERLRLVVAALARWASREDVRARLHVGTALPETAWWLLHRLGDGPSRSSELASWQGVDRSTITTQVQRLTDAGLVERNQDPDDGRVVVLSLTAEGRAAVERSRRAGAEVFGDLLSEWDVSEREAFLGGAEKLARLLG